MMDQFDGAFELLRDTFWAAVVSVLICVGGAGFAIGYLFS